MTEEKSSEIKEAIAAKVDAASRRAVIATIYDQLRKRICTLTYPTGTILREQVLAKEFGVSKTPVREAILRLQVDGLVTTRHGVGSLVIAGDRATAQDIFALRVEITELVAKLSPRQIDAATLEAMENLVAQSTVLQEQASPDLYWELDGGRQKLMNGLIVNVELAQLHDLYYYKMAPFWFGLCVQDIQREADNLIRELRDTLFWMKAGNVKAAFTNSAHYIALTMDRVLDTYGLESDFLEEGSK